jgi:hypothetical protein
MTNNELEQWADSRDCSIEIAIEIQEFCNGNLAEMQNEFNDGFNSEEIIKKAFNNSSESVLFWGNAIHK